MDTYIYDTNDTGIYKVSFSHLTKYLLLKVQTAYHPAYVCFGRAHLEASAERWSRLLGLLEELWRWICMKDEDLAKQMPIGGDVPTLLQQQNYCTVRPVATGNVPAT